MTLARVLLGSLAVSLVTSPARADSSASAPTAINLPKGPGALDGFGQAFDVSPATALPGFSHALVVPPGRAGLAPELALRYQPGTGAGPFGLDWDLGLPAIERSTRRGIPRGDDDDVLVLRGLGRGEDLVEVATGRFRERVEGPAPVVVTRSGPGFSAQTRDGRRWIFGSTAASRQPGAAPGSTHRWNLEAIVDPFGNRIELGWRPGVDRSPPRLDAIAYNDGTAEVALVWEPRPDPIVSRISGTEVRLEQRVAAIETRVDGAPVRRYTLGYGTVGGSPSSLLTSIACAGADGTALPTWTMTYRGLLQGEAATIELAGAPVLDPTAEGRALVDVDGDAVPDLLETVAGRFTVRRSHLGRALAPRRQLVAAPSVAIDAHSRFADVDGDGLLDLLVRSDAGGAGTLRVFTGSFEHPFAVGAEVEVEVGFGLDDAHVALVDLDGDGRVDVLRAERSDTFVWLSLEQGGFSAMDIAPPLPEGMTLDEPGVRLADMDGDGLAELVRLSPRAHAVEVAAGWGYGEFGSPASMRGVPRLEAEDRLELHDLNGDGAADLCRIGLTGMATWINDLTGGFVAGPELTWPAIGADEVVQILDMDADGALDVLLVDPVGSSGWRWVPLLGRRPGLMERIDNGLGRRIELQYSSAADAAARAALAGDPWARPLPIAVPVLSRTVEFDRAGMVRSTEHDVRDGHWDRADHEFRGFAVLREVRAGDAGSERRVHERSFDLGIDQRARKQVVLEERFSGDRGLLRRLVSTWQVAEPAAGVSVARQVALDVWHVEGDDDVAVERVRTEYLHDEWGNVVSERAWGRVDPATAVDLPGDERVVVSRYARPLEGGPHDRLAERVTRDGEGRWSSAERWTWDGEPERGLPLGSVARGAPAAHLRWIEGDRWEPLRTWAHDAHGNPVLERDGEGGALTRTYDDLGLFPVQESRILDRRSAVDALVTRAEWDGRLGVPVAVIDPAGARTEAIHDDLGRLIGRVEPGDDPEAPTLTVAYLLDSAAPRVVVARRAESDARAELEVRHLDGLGRVHQRVTADDEGSGAIVAEAIAFAADEQPFRTVLARRVDGEALARPLAIDDDWSARVVRRDALGREVEVVEPDGRRTVRAWSPLVEVVRDSGDLSGSDGYADAPRTRRLDGLGRVRVITDALARGRMEYRFEHDVDDRLLAFVDAGGWETRYVRDGAGRVVEIDSPDAGIVLQRFDRADRLVERVDATGAALELEYDALGRPIARILRDGSGRTISQAELSWDLADERPSTATHGRLAEVVDDVGSTLFDYDGRGNVVRTERLFDVEGSPVRMVLQRSWDAQGRPTRELLPDGRVVVRSYSQRGLEAAVGEFVPRIAYDAAGRWERMELGNGAAVERGIDPVGRVTALAVEGPDRPLLDLEYRYDAAGLLSAVVDGLAASGPTDLDQTFVHDDAHRLVAAVGGYGSLRWLYGDDGNLLEHAGSSLGYARERPHAAITLGEQRLSYDRAGRLAAITGAGPLPVASWSHDSLGLVREVVLPDGRSVVHHYDHEDRRTARIVVDGSGRRERTYYLGPELELRDQRLVHWIFAAGERVAEVGHAP